MSMVKLTSQNQSKVRGLSKVVWIVSRIAQPLMIIAAVFLILGAITVPAILNQIKVEDDKIIIAEEVFTYNYEDGVLELTHGEDTQKIEFDKGIDLNKYISSYSSGKYTLEAELLLISGAVSTILLFLVFKKTGDIFKSIANDDTPFTLENITSLKHLAIYYLIYALLPVVIGLISNLAIQNPIIIKFNFNLMPIIFAIIIFVAYYIFMYGYELQIDSEAKMYGNDSIENK